MNGTHFYSDEKNTQILIALLKAHGIRDLILSPGATNDSFVLSVQGDEYFNLYSAVDERHAGYLAVGMAEETGNPVVINCTGATASRNYMPAMTEAYYRKLPILAVTSSQHSSHIGNMWPQMTDRIHLPADVATLSVQCPMPKTFEEIKDCELKINRAILCLTWHGGGPVHINLETIGSRNFNVSELPETRVIKRFSLSSGEMPSLPQNAKIAVWVGSHRPFNRDAVSALESFVLANNAVVLGDLTSNYMGKGYVQGALVCSQRGRELNPAFAHLKPDLIIHIGEISGDSPVGGFLRCCKVPVWRVSEDGELRDYLMQLRAVFEMPEDRFFSYYATHNAGKGNYLEAWESVDKEIRSQMPDVAFSNLWLSQQLSALIPQSAELHLGILNSLRAWNLTNLQYRCVYSNVGGFGIDGCMSSLIGASLKNPSRLYFGVFGDLAFFYDLNSLGSRHIQKNIRILLVNNGEGGEFSIPGHISDVCGNRVHDFIAAKGHYGKKSPDLVKHIATDLGFKYMSASTKEDFLSLVGQFVCEEITEPIIFECFTDVAVERKALADCRGIAPYEKYSFLGHGKARALIKRVTPPALAEFIRQNI